MQWIRTMNGLMLSVMLMVALLGTSCGSKVESSLLPPNVDLQSGDIVLRCGSGLTSRAVLWADNEGSYSHVGIVADSAGVKMIVHAVPDEHDGDEDVDRVKMERPELFFSSVRTSNGCVLRYPDSLKALKAGREAYRIYSRGMLFDHDYNDLDTTKMYCCELVEFVYQKEGISIVGTERHDIRLPVLSYEHVILPSGFLNSKELKAIVYF